MLTVMFVDDEPNILQGLRRSTRRLRTVWDMHFVESGPAAIDLLTELDVVDVVVSDMRMPGMDGAELLTRVRETSPRTARIILSGQSDHDAVFRAIGPAHQYLSKPCDTDELERVIERVRTASDHILLEPVHTLVGQVDRLPSPPAIFQRLVETIKDPDACIGDVAEIVSEDVALTTELLKLVNSPFFGFFANVESAERAVSLLGMEMIRGIILGAKVFEPCDDLAEWLDLDALATRSRTIAATARGLALREGATAAVASEAYLSGMVAEVGLLIMARLPGINPTIGAAVNERYDCDIERKVFGGNRFRVSSYLLSLWGFSEVITQAISALATPEPAAAEGLAWHLLAARVLVLSNAPGVEQVADPKSEVPWLVDALEQIRQGVALDSASNLVP